MTTSRAARETVAEPVYPRWIDRHFDAQRRFIARLTPNPFASDAAHGELALHLNDYLRLGTHPAVVRARQAADADTHGGTHADTRGSSVEHAVLCALLRESMQTSDVLLASSGWTANVGLLEAIAAPHIPVYCDEQAHGSMRDGARLAGAPLIVVPHHDLAVLERRLRQHGPGVVCVDAVNSTLGCRAPLLDYLAICEASDSVLVLDESHAFGMMGTGGGGLAVASGAATRVHFRTTSFGKALGGHGGAIAVGRRLGADLALRLHPILFSSATSPALAAGHACALRMAMDQPDRAERCLHLADQLRRSLCAVGLRPTGAESQIVSIRFPDVEACQVHALLRQRGVLAALFVPPVIPYGSLLRFTVHTELTWTQIDEVASATERAIAEAQRSRRIGGVQVASHAAT